MTPIFRFLDRHLPRALVYPALVTTYAAMLAGIALCDPPYYDAPIIYIDLRE